MRIIIIVLSIEFIISFFEYFSHKVKTNSILFFFARVTWDRKSKSNTKRFEFKFVSIPSLDFATTRVYESGTTDATIRVSRPIFGLLFAFEQMNTRNKEIDLIIKLAYINFVAKKIKSSTIVAYVVWSYPVLPHTLCISQFSCFCRQCTVHIYKRRLSIFESYIVVMADLIVCVLARAISVYSGVPELDWTIYIRWEDRKYTGHTAKCPTQPDFISSIISIILILELSSVSYHFIVLYCCYNNIARIRFIYAPNQKWIFSRAENRSHRYVEYIIFSLIYYT